MIDCPLPGGRQAVTLYDTTLRDGSQREGASLTVADKLRIAAKLDALGIDYIEGGFPASNPLDNEFYRQAASLGLGHAALSAFGTTAHKGTRPQDDAGLAALVACPAPVVTLLGKAWAAQAVEVLGTSAEENLRTIGLSVRYLVEAGKRVFLDAEHFFDSYKDDPAYALAVLAAAEQAGAEALVLCDTNGGTLPHEVYEITKAAVEAVGARGAGVSPTSRAAEVSAAVETTPALRATPPKEGNVDAATAAGGARGRGTAIGIHVHDDAGCAVASSLEAVRAGATQVQGTINGFGERVGNANLVTVAANLQLKMGYEVLAPERLALLTQVAHLVSETFNVTPDAHLPYVGQNAFSHKGGIHASASLRCRRAYEHIDPALVGNFSRIVVSELAGRASLAAKAQELGVALPADEGRVQALLDTVKLREAQGYSYEAADASLALLLRAQQGEAPTYFVLESFRVLVEKREDGRAMSEATIKLLVDGERHVATGEGNGPVNALDAALRLAIRRFYPQVEGFELTDYKVRVLDESTGTGAVTRVLIETSDGQTSWGTVGVSENVIEASWDALVEAMAYGLLKKR